MEMTLKDLTGMATAHASGERRALRRMVLPLSQEIDLRYARPRPTASDPMVYNRAGRMRGPNSRSGSLLSTEA
jgi:hypothetical protein